MRELLLNKSNFTSRSYEVESRDGEQLILLIAGSGTVSVEIEGMDGTWRGSPEMAFTPPTSQVVLLPPGKFHIKVVGGPATVEFWK